MSILFYSRDWGDLKARKEQGSTERVKCFIDCGIIKSWAASSGDMIPVAVQFGHGTRKKRLRWTITALLERRSKKKKKKKKYCPPADQEPPSVSIGHWNWEEEKEEVLLSGTDTGERNKFWSLFFCLLSIQSRTRLVILTTLIKSFILSRPSPLIFLRASIGLSFFLLFLNLCVLHWAVS